jgi:hypothetical protein
MLKILDFSQEGMVNLVINYVKDYTGERIYSFFSLDELTSLKFKQVTACIEPSEKKIVLRKNHSYTLFVMPAGSPLTTCGDRLQRASRVFSPWRVDVETGFPGQAGE